MANLTAKIKTGSNSFIEYLVAESGYVFNIANGSLNTVAYPTPFTGGPEQPPASETTPGLMSAEDKLKLDGIATAATANQTDAYLLSRTNHTGAQASSTITNFSTEVNALAAQTANVAIEQVTTVPTPFSPPASDTPVAAASDYQDTIAALQAQITSLQNKTTAP